MTSITDRAMLSKLTIGAWSASKLDRKESAAVAEKHGATSNVAKVYKELMVSPELSLFRKNADAARIYQWEVTLPWIDGGTRILPSDFYFEYNSRMREFKEKAEQLADDIADNFIAQRNAQQARLGSLFDENDYMSPDSVRRRFYFDLAVFPIPDASDWRVKIGDEEEALIKADITERLEAATNAAMMDLWDRVYKIVDHMHERLSDKDKQFTKTLVTNAEEIADLLPKLNVTDDPELDKMGQEIKLKLCAYDAAGLRHDRFARKTVAESADEILKKMSPYCSSEVQAEYVARRMGA